MDFLLVLGCVAFVIWLYFRTNPLKHSKKFMFRRFINWFPLGMTYAFLYMARYNLSVSKNALGAMMTKEDFGLIFGIGTLTYGVSFLLTGPLVDIIGGKKGILIAAIGSSIANVMMGIATYLFLNHRLTTNLTVTFAVLYSINMFFQSYGGVSIIKVKAYWFHVRERGIFGAIFGTLISFGVYFAFDWGQAIADAAKVHVAPAQKTWLQNIFQSVFAIDNGTVDATWLVFFIPAAILIFWAIIDLWLIKDTPGEAHFEDFDTADASSGEMDQNFTMGQLLKRIFTSPVLLLIACVEFTSGVLRNGIMQWYFIFAKEVKQPGAEFFLKHWGLLLCITGIIGGFAAGFLSDKVFHSRRGPPVAIANVMMFVLTVIMSIVLLTSPITVGTCAVMMTLAAIAVHSMMSGTAAADFGGRKATATASGITDGFVYLGSGLQSICLGYLTTRGWQFWPVFLVPFTVLGLFFAMKMWKALPEATKRYLKNVEHVDIVSADGIAAVDVEAVAALNRHR